MNMPNTNNALHCFYILRRILFAFSFAVISFQRLPAQVVSQMDEMNVTIKKLVKTSTFPNENEARTVAEQMSATSGKQAAIERLVDYVRNQPADVDELHAVRLIGSHFGLEFGAAIVQAAATTDDPSSRARLLIALRNADASVIPSLARFLQDTRTAEFAKRRNAEGPGTYRLCDIAYNVILEIEAIHKSDAPQIRRSDDIKSRDSAIKALSVSLFSPKAP